MIHNFKKGIRLPWVLLRSEPGTNNVNRYAVNKTIEHLPQLATKLSCIGQRNPNQRHRRSQDQSELRWAGDSGVLQLGTTLHG